MAINDIDLTFSDAQAITTAAATPSTNIVDLVSAGVFVDQDVEFCARVNTTCTSDGSATVTCTLQMDNDAAFGSPTTVQASSAIAVASLVGGYTFLNIRLPVSSLERYLRVLWTVAVADLTAGKFDAQLNGGMSVGAVV